MYLVWQDVANLLSAALSYTAGIVILVCFALIAYLSIDLIGQLLGRD